MKYFLFTIALILVSSVAIADEAFFDGLDDAGINYSYSDSGKLVILKTKETAEAVKNIQRVPADIDLEIVEYKFE